MTEFKYETINDEFFVKKSFTMTEVAKMINVKGIGRTKLYGILREKEIVNDDNAAHDQYIELGYFCSIQTAKSYNKFVTTVTPLGMEFIKKMLI